MTAAPQPEGDPGRSLPDTEQVPEVAPRSSPGRGRTSAQLEALRLAGAREFVPVSGSKEATWWITVAVAWTATLVLVGYGSLQPFGWISPICALVLWGLVRVLGPRLFPGYTSAFTSADEAGTVYLHGGRRRLEFQSSTFAGDVRTWAVNGFMLGIGIVVLLIAVCVPLALFLPAQAGLVPPLSFVLAFALVLCTSATKHAVFTHSCRVARRQELPPSTVLALLALYSRHHGAEAAVAGVPADVLMDELRHADSAEQQLVAKQMAMAAFSR